MNLDKYTELTDVSFEHEGAHIAIVHALQGGAANNWHDALITKATSDITDEAIQKALESTDTLSGSSVEQETEASASESKPDSEGVTKAEADNQNNVGEKMTDNVNVEAQEMLKAAEVELQKAKAELEELRKAKEELEKAKQEAVKAQYVELVKGYSFVDEAEQEGLVNVLMKAATIEGADVFVGALEKAQAAITKFATDTVGVDGEGEVLSQVDKEQSLVRKALDARKQNKNK
jgi:hypothetical protein